MAFDPVLGMPTWLAGLLPRPAQQCGSIPLPPIFVDPRRTRQGPLIDQLARPREHLHSGPVVRHVAYNALKLATIIEFTHRLPGNGWRPGATLRGAAYDGYLVRYRAEIRNAQDYSVAFLAIQVRHWRSAIRTASDAGFQQRFRRGAQKRTAQTGASRWPESDIVENRSTWRQATGPAYAAGSGRKLRAAGLRAAEAGRRGSGSGRLWSG